MAPLPFQRNIDSCHPEEPRLLRENRLWSPQTRKDPRHPERISSGSTGELFAGGRPARGIVSEELWSAAQVKLLAQSKRYEPVNRSKTEQAHLLSALVKCPVCGAGMYSNKCTKRKKDGTPYKSFSYYSCKHRKMQRGQKCDFNKQIQEEVLDNAVVEVIIKLVSIQSLPP